MCNGNCRQGRDCPDWMQCVPQEPSAIDVIKEVAIIVLVVLIIALLSDVVAALLETAQ